MMKFSKSRKLKGICKFYTGCVLILCVIIYSNFKSSTDFGLPYKTGLSNHQKDTVLQLENSYTNEKGHAGRILLQKGSENIECRDVHKNKTQAEKCEFVQNTSSCAPDGGLNYNSFIYCTLGHAVWGAMIILVLWWLFCFVGLAVTADDFFCPSLLVISSTLKLSPNVAGVTFLAFGNGAPDLFSALAALSNTTNGDAGLGVGALLGAGMFVTSVVTGTIALITPFKARQRPFLRDVVFYIFGAFWTFYVLWRGRITLAESIGFICFYVIYVIVVIITHSIYKRMKKKREAQQLVVNIEPADGENLADNTPVFTVSSVNSSNGANNISQYSVANCPPYMEVVNTTGGDTPAPTQASTDKPLNIKLKRQDSEISATSSAADLHNNTVPFDNTLKSAIKMFLRGVNPVDTEAWCEMGIFKKIYEVFKSPIILILKLTCPVVNYDIEDTHNWNKYLQCVQCLLTPLEMSIITRFGFYKLGDVFPLWALMIFVGVPLSVLVFCTSVTSQKPRYHWAFGYAGFLVSMIWIYTIADIIVNILQTFGIVFNISDAILGLTLLAWGNSIGDWISDTVMARQGFARMGFAACFGAPFFNLMLGFGLPMLITMAKTGETQVNLTITPVQLILTSFLLGNLCFNFVFVNISQFNVNRLYGVIEVCFYLTFLTLALLTESGVILSDWVQHRTCMVDCNGT